MQQSDSVQSVKGIGEKTAQMLAKLEIFTVGDLLHHYPRDYEVYELPVPIANLREGSVMAIEAGIATFAEVKRMKGLTVVSCNAQDMSGTIRLTWFNQVYLKNVLKRGTHYIFRGRIVRKGAALVMDQPKIYKKEEYRVLLHVLQPIYPLTAGLTNRALQKAANQALCLLEAGEDYLPKRIVKQNKLISQKAALGEIHFPKSMETMLDARKRLVFDEFFRFAVCLRKQKESRLLVKNHFLIKETETCRQFLQSLPYQLTAGQEEALKDIRKDMTGEYTMNRLLQGDVGSGKTVLAEYALLLAATNGYQGCIMAPTEVLARQHYESMRAAFEPLGIRVELLVGSMGAAAKKAAYARIAGHEADVVIGTHALIQEKVLYDKLALVITDEQHRFGVRQRESLAGKGEYVHVLVMSATPIPRTLAIVLYGDLDVSLIKELPAERLPIKNCVVGTSYRPTAFRFIAKQVQEGRQAYVICPMVEQSEEIEAENVTEYTRRLREELPEQVTVEALHGKQKAALKNDLMEQFAQGKIQVLVSTTVVEVGVNVPNATVMMIEDAERFGLAQLHQLRGRVGRGAHQSYCIFVNGSQDEKARERLEIMNRSNDGFYIAGEDLKLRGPGDVFGVRQSGEMQFELADIYRDADMLTAANAAAEGLTQEEYLHICSEIGIKSEKVFH
ncbi:MAG: ATP-dependent DNA helicase RecG [Lachnospiraceae bacterium]|nr:ATP-dependent DNA helicase RecG [Lachnospiraceae bacterium]